MRHNPRCLSTHAIVICECNHMGCIVLHGRRSKSADGAHASCGIACGALNPRGLRSSAMLGAGSLEEPRLTGSTCTL